MLGALVGLGAAQFLIILFSLCLCRVLNQPPITLSVPWKCFRLQRSSQTTCLGGPSLIVLRWNSFYILLFKKRIFRRRDGDKMIIISDMQQMKSPLLGSLLSAKKILINDIRSQNLANLRRKFMKFSETYLIFPGWRFAPHY